MSDIPQRIYTFSVHCYRLKTALALMVICWGLLIFEFPTTLDAPPPRWLTAVYAMAKVVIGLCAWQIFVHEIYPTVRISLLLQEYRDLVRANQPELAKAAALVFLGACLLVGMLGMVIINSLAVW
jgi:hypothetical protein